MIRHPFFSAVAIVLALACTRREEGLKPVGGREASLAQKERFVRRLHLDLTAKAPTEAQTQAALDRFAADGNRPGTRLALAQELTGDAAFADTFVAELENRAFAGQSFEDGFNLICSIVRTDDAECAACPAPPPGDPCGDCGCALLTYYRDQRAGMRSAPADLLAGATTSEIERRFAESISYRVFLGAPETVATALFDDFLLRAPEADELRNAAAMVQGALIEGSPAGLLFHRHGGSYEDLMDILFGSEVYREAVVNGVFLRYLGRPAEPNELRYFAQTLDAQGPDARPLIEAVVASQEYFDL